jgi:hypothetical protein
MAKTTFSSGVIVTSEWLNGSQKIFFDGQDLDWHYPPLGLSSINTAGPDGLDGRYFTMPTDQPVLEPYILPDSTKTYKFSSGLDVSGTKVVTGIWNFGYDPNPVLSNPRNAVENAPRSYITNDKYTQANGLPNPTISQKFDSLDVSDIVTKLILSELLQNTLSLLVVDNGYYYVNGGNCNNYSTPDVPPVSGNTDIICNP